MKHVSALIAISLLSVGSSQSEDRVLRPLVKVDHFSIVCGCTFRETLSGTVEGDYGSGSELVVFAPNADPPYALVNIGRGNLQLRPVKPIEFPLYRCEAGERFVSEWKSAEVALVANLRVTGSGEESCWFSGIVHANATNGQAAVPVKGGCGC